MTDQVADTLLSIAQAFTATKTPGANICEFTFELLGPTDQRGGISIVENLVETVLKDAPVDLSFVLKDVRFATSPIADDTPIGGQPILDILTPGLTTTETNPPKPPGISGLITALAGTIPLPIQQNVANPLSVKFDVKWSVLDEDGNTASDVNWTLGPNAGTGGAIPVQEDQNLTALVLKFVPQPVELTVGMPLTVRRRVTVSICVTAMANGGVLRATSGWISLPPLDIIIPVIPVPTMAIFFSKNGAPPFAGDTLVAVPEISPLDESTFKPALDAVNSVLSAVGTATAVGGFLLQNFADIPSALSAAGNLKFKKADKLDLHDVEFAGASFLDWNGEDGDDHFVAMMMIGPPGRKIDCFNEDDFSDGQGQMTVTIDKGLFVELPDLGSSAPVSKPPNLVTVSHGPDGWNWAQAHSITDFRNELSSYRFGWA